MSRELQLRILSAVVLAVVALVATWMGGVVFSLFAVAIALLIFYEWSTMTGFAPNERYTLFGWISLIVVLGQLLLEGPKAGALISLYLLIGFAVACALIAAVRHKSYWLAGGVFYAGLSGISLAALRDVYGIVAIVFIFAVVWGTDIVAYFVGRAIGGPKLAPRISPGKTWSGAIGGTFAGIVAGCMVVLLTPETLTAGLVVFTLVLSVGSQIGDLFESFIKRRFGVKDSSHLIPGHGGVMDRVDGLVFACFLAFLGTLAFNAASGHLASAPGEIISGN
jgi:phosphatidate cytidylyltransferase